MNATETAPITVPETESIGARGDWGGGGGGLYS